MMLFERFPHCCFYDIPWRTPAAANAKYQLLRNQAQKYARRLLPAAGYPDIQPVHHVCLIPGSLRLRDRVITEISDRFSIQKSRRNLLCQLPVCQHKAVIHCPDIDRSAPPHVGGCRHNRYCIQDFRDPFRQTVCAAHMTGKKGNGKLPGLIHHNHSRIRKLIFQVWSNQPHRDPGCPNKDHSVTCGKLLPGPL